MKKTENDPIAVMVGGLERLVVWAPLLFVLAALGFVGTVTFAVLWWLG
jgi:hypothetical protein